METVTHTHPADAHRDDTASKIGMWLFIFTEILLFGGLFIVYSVYRYMNPVAFHLAHEELSITMGFINTIILLVSSATVASPSRQCRKTTAERPCSCWWQR